MCDKKSSSRFTIGPGQVSKPSIHSWHDPVLISRYPALTASRRLEVIDQVLVPNCLGMVASYEGRAIGVVGMEWLSEWMALILQCGPTSRYTRMAREYYREFVPIHRTVHIGYIAVHPEFRGRSVAKQTLGAALTEARRLGARIAVVECTTREAVKLLGGFGFMVAMGVPYVGDSGLPANYSQYCVMTRVL